MVDLMQGIITTTTRRTDHTPIMVPDIDVTADHSPYPIHAPTKVAVLEGTPRALLPATTAAHPALQPMHSPVTHCSVVTPHPALTTSPTVTTQATPWTGASLTPATPTTQHKDSNTGKSSNAQDPQPLPLKPHHPKTITIQDSPSDSSSDSDGDSDPLTTRTLSH